LQGASSTNAQNADTSHSDELLMAASGRRRLLDLHDPLPLLSALAQIKNPAASAMKRIEDGAW
jgi:hypothetical protein